jgi:ribonuclease BN (tRNA processing enzyme)
MRLTFAGSGSAFTVGADNYQSNILLTIDRSEPAHGEGPPPPAALRHLLIDCGSDARYSLPTIGIKRPTEIDAVFITHTHADHIGGLEWLALSCHFGPSRYHPRLIVAEELREQLWERSLSGGLMYTEEGPATLDTYFEVDPVGPDRRFVWEGVSFEIIPVVHVDAGSIRMMSYGLYMESDGLRVYFSADAKFDAQLETRHYIKDADVIFHDCENTFRTGVHSHYEDLRNIPRWIREKTWLYHVSPGVLPDCRADHFRGFVKPGQIFDLGKPETFLPIDEVSSKK